MKRKNRLIFALAGLLLLTCAKSGSPLPAKTHEGRNTSGYRMNEQLIGGNFSGRDDVFTFGESTIEIIDDERFGTHFKHEDYVELSMIFSHDEGEDILFIGGSFSIKNEKYASEEIFGLDSTMTNFAEITFVDYEKKILSGLFELNFKPTISVFYSDTTEIVDTSGTIQILDGRFDLRATD